VVTGHHRLLDLDDVRQAWGTYDQCLAVLSEIRSERNIAPAGRHLVLLLCAPSSPMRHLWGIE